MKLDRRYVEKPWGRTELPPMFDVPAGKRIGEVWFTGAGDQPLLAKYIFTSERLSVQVHPDDKQARARGLAHGKSECWYVLDADAGAVIGLGLRRPASGADVRTAALDGSIEHLLEWRSVRTGDFFMVPAGTIHAIGAGISLLEFQQNADVTYRLYDYGRPRELHVDDAVAVSRPQPYPDHLAIHLADGEERTLVDGPHFRLASTSRDLFTAQRRWVMPLEGSARSNGDIAAPGECLLVDGGDPVEVDGRALIGATA